MTELVGREEECARIASMLTSARLVTLVGPGGIGKTRLSLAVAAAATEKFDDGAVFVPLAETTDTDVVIAAIAAALDVEAVPGQRLLDSITEHIAELSLLLVLDNFEQVMVAKRVVSELLAAAPGVNALITSRERLSLYGERVYRVPPLALPDLNVLTKDPSAVAKTLAEFPSLALFEQRAQAVDEDFVLSEETLPAVAALCHRLDGLPLAIELAAARIDQWSPRSLLAHLANHLDALGDGPADLPARQQTLRGAIDWSVLLLEPADQRLFSQLAVFAGGCTLAAALEATCAGESDGDDASGAGLAERLEALAGKSLLVLDSEPAEEPRYRMLETIRAHALARLTDDPTAAAVRRRHGDYFAALAERSADEISGPNQVEWSARISREYLNMRGAFTAAMDRGEVETGVRFCRGLWRYWSTGNHIDEGRDWCDQVLRAPDAPRDSAAMDVLYAAAVLADEQEDHPAAYRYAQSGLALAEALGDQQGVARAHNGLGNAAITRGDYEIARTHYEQSLSIWRALGGARGTAIALGNLTKVYLRLGDFDVASRSADECLLLERAAGNSRNVLLTLECVVDIQLARHDLTGARESLKESMQLCRELGDAAGEAMALHQLGTAALMDGDRAEALRLLTDALVRRHELGDRQDLAVSLDSVADVVSTSNARLAAELLGAAEALRARHGLPVPADLEAERQATLSAVRAALEESEFEASWVAGRSAPLDLIVDRASDSLPPAA
jgi:predicted ATPase